jgi:4-amino-4-deoxy-L-arabinose transferase-like glycosyltransferase
MPRSRFAALTTCGILFSIFAATSLHAWWDRCFTYDEPLHLVGAWAQTHNDDFRCNPEDPPLWKYYAVAGISQSRIHLDTSSPAWNQLLVNPSSGDFVSHALFETPNIDPDSVLFDARLHMLPLGILLGILIAWWAWRLAGPIAAVVAAAAFSLDPNFLAHSTLVKNDVPLTLLLTALMGTVWLIGERVTFWRCLAAALLLGMAITTKFSGLLAIPILALALFARAVGPTPWPILRLSATTRFHRLIVSAAIGLFCVLIAWPVIWANYDFRFSPGPNADTITDLHDVVGTCAFCETVANHNLSWGVTTQQVQALGADWHPSPIINASLWINNNHLLPQSFIRGFLYTYATTLYRTAFLCGNLSLRGWWYYFPLAMAFKTPLATLIALPLAAAAWLWPRRKIFRDPRSVLAWPRWWSLCALAIAPAFYTIMALRSHVDLGLRHIFPVYPFLFIFLGVAAADAYSRRPKIAGVVVALLALGLAAETFSASPDFLSFFNIAAGGARGGAFLLADSNIDWGQDLKSLADWRKSHPQGQLALAYFGTADPRHYGLHYVNLPGSQAPDNQPTQNVPHVYAISVTFFQGIYITPDQHQQYLQFRKDQPAAILGGSIYVFNQP